MSKNITGGQVLALLQIHMRCTAKVPLQLYASSISCKSYKQSVQAQQPGSWYASASLQPCRAQLTRLGQADRLQPCKAPCVATIAIVNLGKHRTVTEPVQHLLHDCCKCHPKSVVMKHHGSDVYDWQDLSNFSPRELQGSHSLHPSLVLHAWQHPPEELLAFLHTCHHL